MAGTYDCWKCCGTGRVPFKHIAEGVCFTCGGSGKLNYRKREQDNFVPVAPIVPEAERSTTKQWEFLANLTGDSDRLGREILREAGAPCASQIYVTKAVMSRAIEIAQQRRAA